MTSNISAQKKAVGLTAQEHLERMAAALRRLRPQPKIGAS